ncbi:MAG: hypothetical protein LAO21_17775 [Acidobacteriia bacterium]|nr:hypothetical protein [Terriglobia bacterium]
MAKLEATLAELVSMIERGRMHLLEMQLRYAWWSTRVHSSSSLFALPGDA